MSEPNAVVKFADPDQIPLTLTITLPLRGWKFVADREYWEAFHSAVRTLINKASLQIEGEVEPKKEA